MQGQASVSDWSVLYPDEEYIFGDFTERLWAYLTIEQLLEKRSVAVCLFPLNGFSCRP